jgi:hypothetical protein
VAPRSLDWPHVEEHIVDLVRTPLLPRFSNSRRLGRAAHARLNEIWRTASRSDDTARPPASRPRPSFGAVRQAGGAPPCCPRPPARSPVQRPRSRRR